VSEPLALSEQRLQERFEALGPWYTRHTVDGRAYGGAHDYATDWRVGLFFHWFGRPRTILELGSFEGAHSLMLADPEHVERVLGLEGRAESIRRAEFVTDLLGKGKIAFEQSDLETDDLSRHGRFDAVFCAGLLYHLQEPWRLLAEIAKITDRLYLDTHYASTEAETRGSYVGASIGEGGYDDALSGLGARSFWLSLPALIAALNDVGFAVRHIVDDPDWSPAGRRAVLGCCKLDDAAVKVP
jgi:SAM-dependent methyltransferase